MISDDTNQFNFERVNGLVVNRNPSNGALFGRTYVANARSNPTVNGRPVTDGVYILAGDYSDAVGQGDTARDAGLLANFVGGGNSSPWRLALDDAGQVYIADWADATGTMKATGGTLYIASPLNNTGVLIADVFSIVAAHGATGGAAKLDGRHHLAAFG